LYTYFETQQKDLLAELAKGDLGPDLEAKMNAAVKTFTQQVFKEGAHK